MLILSRPLGEGGAYLFLGKIVYICFKMFMTCMMPYVILGKMKKKIVEICFI